MFQSLGVVLKGDSQLDIVTEAVASPLDSQVLVQTHAVGLCGSDISLYRGTYQGPNNYPLYFGHEWSGIVEAVGPAVTRVKPGDKVTGDCSIYCGACEFCKDDRNLCQHVEKFGITIDGASRQYFLQDERYVYRAHPATDLDIVALSEPLAVGAHAVHRVETVRPRLQQERILVLGGGTIGLSCLFALIYLAGCRHVELFDLIEERVEKAIALGAMQPTDVTAQQAEGEDYGGLYSGRGYDVIFETTASPAALRRAVDQVRPLGTIMTLGFLPSVEFNLKTITLKAAHIMGSMGGTGEFERVLDFTTRFPEVAGRLITHSMPHTEAARAFEIAEDRRNAMKVLVHFQRP